MGLEWHNRRRSNKGRFTPRKHTTQIHVYCTWDQWQAIRGAAILTCQDMSEFCRNAAMERADALTRGGGPRVVIIDEPITGKNAVSADGQRDERK